MVPIATTGTPQTIKLDVCYQPSAGGSITPFSGAAFSFVAVTQMRVAQAVAGSVVPGVRIVEGRRVRPDRRRARQQRLRQRLRPGHELAMMRERLQRSLAAIGLGLAGCAGDTASTGTAPLAVVHAATSSIAGHGKASVRGVRRRSGVSPNAPAGKPTPKSPRTRPPHRREPCRRPAPRGSPRPRASSTRPGLRARSRTRCRRAAPRAHSRC